MRAVQVIAPGKAQFVETPKPVLKPGHALVRTKRVSLCGSDIHMLCYDYPENYPFPPGTSGNTAGRPKGRRSFLAELADELHETVDGERTRQRRIIRALAEDAIEAEPRAWARF